MWDCQKCGEQLEDSFDVCWACGTAREGVEDPTFQSEPESPPDGLHDDSYARCMRGLTAGAALAVAFAFLFPALMLFINHAGNQMPIPEVAWLWVLRFGLFSTPFAAVGGAVAGTVGARILREGKAVAAGSLANILCNFLFLMTMTNAFSQWRREVLLGNMAFAALAGALAAHVGVVVGRRMLKGARNGD